MKFIYLGYDFGYETVQALLESDHECMAIYSFPCDNLFMFNQQLEGLAQNLKIPFSTKRIRPEDIEQWTNKGAQIFLSAGYLYKIPNIDETKAYGINVHPSYLPKGRGMMPLPAIILKHPEAAGITIHKLEKEYDAGDILLQKKFDIAADETVESLTSRCAIKMPKMVLDCVDDIKNTWQKAQPQNHNDALLIDAPKDEDRMINWQGSINEIKALHRAFGGYGIVFTMNNEIWVAYNLDGWKENHGIAPGTLCHSSARHLVIAANDGFICIKQAEKLQQNHS